MANDIRTGRGQVTFPDKQPAVEIGAAEKTVADLEKRVESLEKLIRACASHIGIKV